MVSDQYADLVQRELGTKTKLKLLPFPLQPLEVPELSLHSHLSDFLLFLSSHHRHSIYYTVYQLSTCPWTVNVLLFLCELLASFMCTPGLSLSYMLHSLHLPTCLYVFALLSLLLLNVVQMWQSRSILNPGKALGDFKLQQALSL